MKFSEAMTSKRLELGYTTLDLSNMTNISAALLNRFERQAAAPGNEDLQVICKALGLNIKYYIDDVMKERVKHYNFLQTRKHERMQRRLAAKQVTVAKPAEPVFKPNHSVCRFCGLQFPFNTGYELCIFDGKNKIFKEHACKKCYKEKVFENIQTKIVVK